eukprot:6175125-Pleurochrysis_carterae.AAC.1
MRRDIDTFRGVQTKAILGCVSTERSRHACYSKIALRSVCLPRTPRSSIVRARWHLGEAVEVIEHLVRSVERSKVEVAAIWAHFLYRAPKTGLR